MKNNKIIYIIIWVIILLFWTFYVVSLLNQKDKVSNSPIVKKKITEKKLYSFDEAIKSLEIENCSKLIKSDISKESLCKDTINNKLAFKNNDSNYCGLIENKKIKLKCIVDLNNYFYTNAIKNNDHELCIMISADKKKEECIKKVDDYYFKKNDCKNIFNQNYKKQCENQISNNLFLEARKASNSNLCNQINDDKLKKDCLTTINNDIYLDSIDLESCNKISDNELKTKCINKVNFNSWNYNKLSKSYCKQLDTEEMQNKCFDWYYLNQIESWKSSLESNCTKIKNIEIQNYCKSILTKNIEKQKTDKEVKQLESKWDYIWAINLKCESNNSWTDIDNCKKEEITKKAIADNDLTICSSLNNIDQKNSCESNATYELDSILFKKAVSEKNIDLCNKLSTKEKQDSCKKYFNN